MVENSKFKVQNSKLSGFTLIELLVVITIISILAALLMANFVGVRQRGRDAERKSNLRQIQAALELYRSDNGYYPTSATFPPACDQEFTANSVTYMQKVPCDPLSDAEFIYTPTANCDNSVITCSTYTLVACIETAADSDDVLNNNCSSTGFSLTYTNP